MHTADQGQIMSTQYVPIDRFNEPGCDAPRPSYESIKSKLTDGRDLPASARFTTDFPRKNPQGIMIPPASR